jgi:FlaG/FlaF family flagellin (archaellin)
VAITVILAAVIASFVLGLGDQNNPAPTADFQFDYDSDFGNGDDGLVTVTHGDGDSVLAENLYIRGDEIDTATFSGSDNSFTSLATSAVSGSGSETTIPADPGYSSGDEVSAGQSANVIVGGSGNAPNEYVINVVWEDPDSDSTSTLSTDEGPDA